MTPTVPYDPRACGARCDECPLRDNHQVIAPQIPTSLYADLPAATKARLPHLVFVSDAPGTQEIQKDATFGGYIDLKLSDLLKAAGLAGDPVGYMHLTHVILCRPEAPNESGRRRYDLKVYQAWLRKENMRRKKAGEQLLLSPFEACAPRFVQEMIEVDLEARAAGHPNGAVVVPMTNIALQHVMNLEKKHAPMSLMKYRGSVIPLEYGKKTTL